jgi:putative transposase
LRCSCRRSGVRKTYFTSLSNEEWACLRASLPELPRTVRIRVHILRDVFDAIFYVLRRTCPWRMLPGDFPP